jgi:hypothetical protein
LIKEELVSGLNRMPEDSSISFGAQIKEEILSKGAFPIKEITGIDIEEITKNVIKYKVLEFIK